ncbi:lysylphosphatidylglycerol synthase transmembrane domain-containing protein [Herbaspirillum huttiense F1]|uniref:lysylphosphatidylglycerol synthase transmembrane domain-containing protein n=1 Tax=Herbaspirillum TaxID=963 RepID=UPI000EB1675B|nr:MULTISPECIES: lysylphosphatidylglycerol synthase transmembrane domain-containing protein [Herbaspirillum]MBP1314843.1 uncharacterized protein (TIRG00374 family) [Herbaspirillum sp. 1130]MDT0358322.1 lysylphosphatidylglycerol synthase transmembrane domain-containing protein [Herbaspirillum huttiense F1]
MNRFSAKQLIRLAVGVGVALVFGWLALRHTDWNQLSTTLLAANKSLILLGLLIFAVGYACRIARWTSMLRVSRPALHWSDCAGPFLASFAANNVLPFRAGDLMRMVAFNQQLGTSAATVVATLFVERLLDLLMVIVMLGAAVLLVGARLHSYVDLGAGALLLMALAIMAVLLFPHAMRPLARFFLALLAKVLPGLAKRLGDEIGKAFDTLESMSRGPTMLVLVGWSLLAWLCEGMLFWLAALSLPAVSEPASAWLALPVGTLATLIPSTPGYVGTFDFFTAKTLAIGGNDMAASTAYALLVHLLLWLPPTLSGGLYLLVRSLRPKKVLEHE